MKVVAPLSTTEMTSVTTTRIDNTDQDVPTKEEIDEIDKKLGYVAPREESRSLAFWQFLALCNKNKKLKLRHWKQTLCELISPALLMMLLVIGLSQSEDIHNEAQVYCNDSFPFVEIANLVNTQVEKCDGDPDCTLSRDDVIDIGTKVFSYDGLITPPPFDLYVAMHKTLVQNMNQDDYERAIALQDVIHSDIGALLRLGDLGFAVGNDASQETREAIYELVDWFNCTSLFFNEVFVGIYDSEEEGVNTMKRNAKINEGYTWSLAVFDELIVPSDQEIRDSNAPIDLDFTIRMNVTNVPSTRLVYNNWRGLNGEYKMYYTSGFLSIQQQIEWYVKGLPRPSTCLNDLDELSRDLREALLNASNDAASNAADAEEIAIHNSQDQATLLANALASEVLSSSTSTNQSVSMCEIANSLGQTLLNVSVEDIVVTNSSLDDWNMINEEARVWFENLIFSSSYSANLSHVVAEVVADMTRVAHTVPLAAISTYESHALSWKTRRSAVSDVLYSAADSLANSARSVHVTSFVRALHRVGTAFQTIGSPASYCEDKCYNLDMNTCANFSSSGCIFSTTTCIYDSNTWTSEAKNDTKIEIERYYENEYDLEQRWGAWNASDALEGAELNSNLLDIVETMDSDREIAKARCLEDFNTDETRCENRENVSTIKGCTWNNTYCVYSESTFLAGQFDRVNTNASSSLDTDWISTLARELAYLIDGTDDVDRTNADAEGLAAVIRTALNQDSRGASLVACPMPIPAYITNLFYRAAGPVLGLFICMSTLYPVSRLVKSIVEEKETRMKEIMLIMGLKPIALTAAWLCCYLVIFLIIATSVTIVLSNVFKHSDPSLIWFLFVTFGVAEISFCFFVASVFSRSKLAAIAAPIMLFASLMPRYIFFGTYDGEMTQSKFLAALLVPSAFTFAADKMSALEDTRDGITWASLEYSTEEFTFANALLMLWVDVVVYGILAWYIENVFPRQYGVPRVWYFPLLDLMKCLRSYDLLCCETSRIRDGLLRNDSVAIDFQQRDLESSNNSRDKLGVSIRNLRKEFGDGQVAVKGLNLDLFKDNITVLLGHNGAGKTTTISMLTGLLPPTSGDAIVYDSLDRPMSVNKDLHLVRKSLGICPQHDVLYPDLTVQEHLVLFAIVKGVRGSDEIDSAVNKQIRAIRLEKKRHTAAKALSGGQRRRLSVAIAMVGDSEVVLLDEPSSGLDPASRRVTWDMLRQSKKDRAIVLTTHFMDEADALGDRIAIMGHGELICCDTPLALKVRYGVGYTLSFDMGIPGNQEEEKSNVSRTELCDVVKKYVSNAVMTSSSAGELSFRLPTNASSSFPSLLEILENEHVRYGIETWGLSMTTLEEVFLSLTKRAHKKETTSKNGKRSNSVFNRLFRRSRVESSSKKKVQTKVSSSGIMNWFRSAADVHVRLEDDDDDDEIIDKETKEEESKISSSSSSSSTNTNNIAKSVWNVKSGSRNSTRQFVESLRKRWISAKRDMKGFFCLIVIPICTVALVLVILHLNVAPTGSSLTLYPDELFGDQNIVVGNSEITRSSRDTCRLIDELSSSSLVTNKYNNNAGEDTIDSVQLSVSPLLEEARSRSRRDSHWPRMGALVFNDTLRLNYEEFGELVEENPNIVSLVPETIFNIFAERAIEVGVPENLVNNLREELESGDNEAIASAFGVIIETGLLDFNSEMDLGNGLTARIELSDDHLHVSFPLGLTVLFNTTSSHSLPAIWNLAFEGQLLGRYDENAVDVPTPSFKVRSHAMPLTDYQNARIAMFLQLFAALFLLIPFSYLPASCAMFVVQERTCGSQHLQLVSGVSPLVYWVSTFVWDITQYFVVIIGCYLVMLMYGATAFVGSAENSFCTIITLLAYGLASIPMSYAYSFAFTRHASAQIAICLMNFVTGFVAIIAHFIMSQIPKTANVAAVLQKIFRFFPQYCLGEAMINLAAQDLYSTLNYGGKKSVFDWDVTGLPITYMLLEGIAMFAIVILLQYNLVQYFWERFSGTVDSFVLSLTSKSSSSNSTSIQVTSSRNRHKNHHDDVDVVKERKLANSDKGLKESAVCLRKLRKEYNRTGKEKIRKVAVQDLDLIVPRRQCMGFLGENGAGKSSTMKMLTGDIEKTSGHAYISGIDISTHRDRVRKLIGYCPQFDPLLPRMTARETLLMYARLKGMPEENLQDVVNSAILTLGLQGHGDKMVNGFSGGMKRKLSLGIALIGDPQVVFLDEPSSGMDPVSRRQMWEIIESAAKHRSVVLTSHHMEECEALCSKVAILVEGKLACVGAIQRLKARFGQGYHLFFRMRDDESFTSNKGARDLTARARVYVMNSFHGAHVVEQDGVSVKMWIPIDASSRSSVVDREKEIKRGRSDVRLSNIFRVMEKNMKDLGIAEYGISQPTLEQVFLEIHSQHKESGSSSSSGKKNSSSSVDDEDMVAITSGNDFHGDDDGSHHFV